MAVPTLEELQRRLEADPASPAWVDLAVALVTSGRPAEAREVCTAGLSREPERAEGHVALGRALLHLGQPVEARAAFEAALRLCPRDAALHVAIGEALLERDLQRSAAQFFRRAQALAPGDPRISALLERAAGRGGAPAPVRAKETTRPDGHTLPPPPEPTRRGFAAGERTQSGYGPAAASPAEAPGRRAVPPAPSAASDVSAETPAPERTQSGYGPAGASPAEAPGQRAVPPAPSAASDVSAETPAPERTQSGYGPAGASPAEAPGRRAVPPAPSGASDVSAETPRGETTRPDGHEIPPAERTVVDALAAVPPPEKTVIDDGRAAAPPPVPPVRGAGNGAPPPLRRDGAGGGAADDLLDLLPLPPAPEESAPPRPEPSTVAEEAASAAAAYERELRERLAAEQARPPSWLRRHRLTISLAVLLTVAAGAGYGAWRYRRALTHEQDVARYGQQARSVLLRDTRAAYEASLEAIDEVLDREASNAAARATKAFVLASLAKRWAHPRADPAEAAALLGPAEAAAEPELALATRLLLADDANRKAVEDEILAVDPAAAGATVHSLAGAILHARGDLEGAIARFNAALAAVPGHVPTLVRVADHYGARREHSEAERFARLALAVVEEHPLALLAAAEARLALATSKAELDEIHRAVERLDGAAVPVADRDRHAIVRARLLAGVERREEALAVLEPLRERARDDQALLPAVAAAYVEVGAPDRAVELFRPDAIDRGTPLAVREAWARSLLAIERFRAVTVVPARPGDRNLHLLAGIAWLQLGDGRKARAALRRTATRQAGKMPADAVVYLALADLRDGAIAKARRNLERLGTGPRARTAGRWAWAELLVREKALAEAEAVLREAVELDRLSVEARCALGRLLLRRGRAEEARAALAEAVARNPFHAEARRELARAELELGALPQARAHLEAALERAPGDPATLATFARLELREGAAAAAERRLEQAARRASRHPEVLAAQAEVALAKGERDEAIGKFRLAARRASADPRHSIRLGEILLEAGDAKGAEAAFGAALAIDAASVEALVGQARALAAGGAVDRAKQRLVARIEALGEDAPAARAVLQDALGALSAGEKAAR